MRTAAWNYCAYRRGKDGEALGRFVVDLARVDELRSAAGNAIEEIRLSVIAGPDVDGNGIASLCDEGFKVEAVECKAPASEWGKLSRWVAAGMEVYVEIPITELTAEVVKAVAGANARLKLRTGGVTAEAFPSVEALSRAIALAAHEDVAFKATAGLHHPLRSEHRLTYAQGSPTGTMHGFVNLVCAAAWLYGGGGAEEAQKIIEEHDVEAWTVTPETIAWRERAWSAEVLRSVRKRFFVSFGSCSFTEPLEDLEALEWR